MGDSASGPRDAEAKRQQPASEPARRGPASQPHPPHQKPQTSAVLPARYCAAVGCPLGREQAEQLEFTFYDSHTEPAGIFMSLHEVIFILRGATGVQ